MIKVKKQNIVIFSFFCLLIPLTTLPIILLEYSNNKLIDKYTIVPLPWELLPQEEPIEKNYDALTRIHSTQDDTNGKKFVVVEWQMSSDSKKEQNEVILEMEKQLSYLVDLKALPEINFSDEYQYTIVKSSYMNMQTPNNPINILEISVSYEDFFITTYMDMETSMLYEISIQSNSNLLSYDLGNVWPAGFLEYLKKDSDTSIRGDEIFDVRSYYTLNVAELSVVSYSKDKQNIKTYSFRNHSNDQNVKNEVSDYEDYKKTKK